MKISKTKFFVADYLWFKKTSASLTSRIEILMEDIESHPLTGLGKPGALKHKLSGIWSRRVDQKNRLLYVPLEDEIILLSCRGHYSD
jgi:toxin YoeB